MVELMSYEARVYKAEKLLNYALNNMFFYRAKSITFDVTNFSPAQILLLNCDPQHYPHLEGKMLRLNDRFESDLIYDSAKILIEQFSTPARPDIEKRMPFAVDFNYVGLQLNAQAKLPCPVLISCINKGGSSFFLQFTAQQLEQKLDILRAELDEWHANHKSFSVRLNTQTNYVI